jgi:hypothetical protein
VRACVKWFLEEGLWRGLGGAHPSLGCVGDKSFFLSKKPFITSLIKRFAGDAFKFNHLTT